MSSPAWRAASSELAKRRASPISAQIVTALSARPRRGPGQRLTGGLAPGDADELVQRCQPDLTAWAVAGESSALSRASGPRRSSARRQSPARPCGTGWRAPAGSSVSAPRRGPGRGGPWPGPRASSREARRTRAAARSRAGCEGARCRCDRSWPGGACPAGRRCRPARRHVDAPRCGPAPRRHSASRFSPPSRGALSHLLELGEEKPQVAAGPPGRSGHGRSRRCPVRSR
jgi:hypothetical protein